MNKTDPNNKAFNKAAEELRIEPLESSWSHLETMLSNDQLQKENKTVRLKMRSLAAIAASLLLLVCCMFVLTEKDNKTDLQVAYSIESLPETSVNISLYDIDKLAILNETYN